MPCGVRPKGQKYHKSTIYEIAWYAAYEGVFDEKVIRKIWHAGRLFTVMRSAR